MGLEANWRKNKNPALVRLGVTVFSTGQVAAMIGCSARTAAQMIDKGVIEGYKLPMSQSPRGNARRVTFAALKAFVEKHCTQEMLDALLSSVGEVAVFVGVNIRIVDAVKAELPLWTLRLVPTLFMAGCLSSQIVDAPIIFDSSLGESGVLAAVKELRSKNPTTKYIVVLPEDKDFADSSKSCFAAGATSVLQDPIDAKVLSHLLKV